MTTNEELFKRANEAIPGGVSSPVRAFRSVGGTPYFVAKAEGEFVWDVEGRKYLDYVQSYGASILGHAHPKVIEAIETELDLPPDALALTWRSLADVGNLSSSSVLHVLADTLDQRRPAPGEHGLLMAMGPGFCSELVLLQW